VRAAREVKRIAEHLQMPRDCDPDATVSAGSGRYNGKANENPNDSHCDRGMNPCAP
jgi:hypothetical protein